MVNRSGTVIGSVVWVAGTTRVVRTTPGRIEPQGEPKVGKLEAPLKFPCSAPVGTPSCVVRGGAMRLPVSPKLGPGPPTYGNCTNVWLKAGRKSADPESDPTFAPPGRSWSPWTIAGPLPRSPFPKKSCEFGR